MQAKCSTAAGLQDTAQQGPTAQVTPVWRPPVGSLTLYHCCSDAATREARCQQKFRLLRPVKQAAHAWHASQQPLSMVPAAAETAAALLGAILQVAMQALHKPAPLTGPCLAGT